MLGHSEKRAWDAVFEALALQHFDALYRLALSYTRNTHDAQDLVQDTYLKAYRFWYRFAPGTHMRAWLFTILRNTFINTYRKEVSYQERTDVAEVLPASGTIIPTPAWPESTGVEEILRYVVQDEVKQALDALPEEYRLVVLLADLEGEAYKDIAASIGCPIGTVMSRLFRGRRLLRQRLERFARRSGYLRPQRPAHAPAAAVPEGGASNGGQTMGVETPGLLRPTSRQPVHMACRALAS